MLGTIKYSIKWFHSGNPSYRSHHDVYFINHDYPQYHCHHDSLGLGVQSLGFRVHDDVDEYRDSEA